MKKNVKKTIVSLALGAMSVCFLGGALPFMNKTEASAAKAYYTMEGFEIEESAAIRTKDFNGIRFTTNLTEQTITTVNGTLTNPQYGTLLLPADMLGSDELTHETQSVVDAPVKVWVDSDTYTAVLAGGMNEDGSYISLPESYYNRPIAARSYVTGTDSKGNTVYYYSENTAVRSIGYVAMMSQLDGNTSDLINSIVSSVKAELAFDNNQLVSVVQANGTVLIENKYQASTDSAAVIKIGGVAISEAVWNKYNASISYTSSDPSVISVDGTTLTALKAGEATITATATFNGQELASVSKTLSTGAYKAQSDYKILISETAANAQLNSATNYLPAQTQEAYDAYYNAFEKTAAYKLQSILAEATGVKLDIVTEVVDGYKYIAIGETALGGASNLAPLTKEKDTASEVWVDEDGNVIICGTTQQGTLYGVQNLLGDIVGYEFFMENTYALNTNVEVALDENKTYIPDIEYNVLQGDLERYGIMDEYAMQMYTEKIIPIGTTETEDGNGYYYKGVAHNSIFVVNNGAYDAEKVYSNGLFGLGASYKYSNAKNYEWQKWYATDSKSSSYKTMNNPYPTDLSETEGINEGVATVFAELCYTAHGDTTERNKMITIVVDKMYAKMQKFPTLERMGFAHMDHRYWCECSSCTAQGNPSTTCFNSCLT